METLIEQSISGDEQAYAKLIGSIKFDLYKVAKSKLTNQDDMDDAFQETIIKSYQNLHKLENKKYFKTWITRILINECNNINQNYVKSNNLLSKVIDRSDFQKFTTTTNNIDNSIYINELFDKLNDDEKQIADLYFRNNLTVDKIATLLNSNKNTVKSKIYRIKIKLKKLAMLLLILCILTTTTVFAIKFIISLFTTSRQAIDTAVENNYVQNVNMDFTYDKDIGIKIDYILMDDKNLNVSYVYDCNSCKNVSTIKLENYSIVDEKNNIIYSTDSQNLTQTLNNFGDSVIIENNFVRHSSLYTAPQHFPLSKKLIFSITEISIKTDTKTQNISGNWVFEINLEDKFLTRKYENYTTSHSEYIENISTTLDETCLIIDLKLNTVFNTKLLSKHDSIVLSNDNTKFNLISHNFNDNNIYLVFDISKYTENINDLNLYIKFDEEKHIDITLTK